MVMHELTFEIVTREIFHKAGYTISEDSLRTGYRFDFLAKSNDASDALIYGVDVRMQLRNYDCYSSAFRNMIEKAANVAQARGIAAIIVFAVPIKDSIIDEIKSQYENIVVLDIKNLVAAVPVNSQLYQNMLASLPYSTYEIVPKVSDILRPWLVHSSYEEELIKRLHNCNVGRKHFAEFEKICTDMLVAIFRDQLTLWRTQITSNSNLYRFDLFCRIKEKHDSTFWGIVENNFFSKYVIFEFKNYNSRIKQEQIYTTEKYLYSKALRTIGIIIAAKGADKNAKIAAKGIFRESGKLLLVLDPGDLEEMLKMKMKGNDPSELLLGRLDDLLMQLEK